MGGILPWPEARLVFNAVRLPSRGYWVGDFVAQWQTEAGGVLSIRPAALPQRAVWASLLGQSFAGAARGATRYVQQSIAQISEQADGLVVAGMLTTPDGDPIPYTFGLRAVAAKEIAFTLAVGAPANHVVLILATDADERFFGFGAPTTDSDRKGRRVVITAAAQAAGRAAPHCYTSRLRAFILESRNHVTFDMRPPQRACISQHAAQMSGRMFYGVNAADLRAAYTIYTARQPTPG